MAYTTVDKSGSHFKSKLYTGTGSSQSITGIGFQPDFVWIKGNNFDDNHGLYDVVRGVEKRIVSNNNGAEEDRPAGLTAFGADGFTVNTANGENKSGAPLISWSWKAGQSQGSSNTDGSINTTYTSANTTAGISIIKYNGNGSAGATIGHGLGVAPKCVMIKRTDTTSNWIFGTHAMGFTKFLYLNVTDTEMTNSGPFNNTAPSSSVITLGTWNDVNNSSGTYICYAFAEKTGFSKAGIFDGYNDNDGPFVFTGFRPSFIMMKGKGIARNWTIWDNARDIDNPHWNYIYPNLSSAGTTTADGANGSYAIDFLSNGFKVRNTDDKFNGSGQGYVYLAFGQSLVGTNDVPNTAR